VKHSLQLLRTESTYSDDGTSLDLNAAVIFVGRLLIIGNVLQLPTTHRHILLQKHVTVMLRNRVATADLCYNARDTDFCMYVLVYNACCYL